MTIYDLTQAVKRHARFLLIAFSVMVVVVLVLTFTFEDGSLTWRAQEKYESSVQIAVVSPDTTSLTTTDVRNDSLRSTASVYQTLLETGEAKLAVGEIAGYELDDPIDANLDDQAPIITATVIAPTPEQSIAAAEGTFTWLTAKLLEPLDTADLSIDTTPTTIPLIFLDGPFESAVTIVFDPSLSTVPNDLFLQVSVDEGDPTTVAVSSNAGSSVSTGATLNTTISLVLRLIGEDDTVVDTVRIAPPPLSSLVEAIPALTIELQAGSVSATALDTADIDTTWTSNVRDSIAEDDEIIVSEVDIALLTSEVGVNPIGGRRGPITAVAVLLVGSLVLLAIVIVMEGWNRARLASMDGIGSAQVTARGDDDTAVPNDDPAAPNNDTVAPNGEMDDPSAMDGYDASDLRNRLTRER